MGDVYKQRTDVELCVSNRDSQSNQEDDFKVHDTIQKRAFIKNQVIYLNFSVGANQ